MDPQRLMLLLDWYLASQTASFKDELPDSCAAILWRASKTGIKNQEKTAYDGSWQRQTLIFFPFLSIPISMSSGHVQINQCQVCAYNIHMQWIITKTWAMKLNFSPWNESFHDYSLPWSINLEVCGAQLNNRPSKNQPNSYILVQLGIPRQLRGC